MATLTVRNFEEEVVKQLRIRAAEHGRSAEAEHRELLRAILLGGGPELEVAGRRMLRRKAADRLAEFRRRISGRGSEPSAELLTELRAGRTRSLAAPGKR